MTRLILLVSTLFSLVTCHFSPRQADCSKFRAGEFYLANKKLGTQYRIVRNDVNQIETDKRSGTTSIFRIKWISPCEYELTFLSKKSAASDTTTFIPPFRVLRTRIISTGDTYYIFESKALGIDITYGDTIWVTKTR